jgi:MFS family permease
MRSWLRIPLSSLAIRNYRLYFIGQVISVSGNWMQQIAIAWLVLTLSNSALELGITTALQSAPYLVVGLWGGVLADRLPKRKLLLCTQFALVLPPLTLWLLWERGTIQMWMIYIILTIRGLINTLDNPARQSFVAEMVGPEQLVNAVSLNSAIIQAGRLIGPALASLIIATAGLGACFLANAATFIAMIGLLIAIRPGELRTVPLARRARGQLREAFTAAARNPSLRIPLSLMAVVGLLSFNFTVVIPAMARFTYHGGPTTYALMTNCLAIGALGGALVSGTRSVVTPMVVSAAAIGFGATLGIASFTGTIGMALVALAAVGATSVAFSASAQALIQLTAAPEMRGRILSLYQIVYMGTTPLGSLLVGALASSYGARSGLVLGSVGAVGAGCYGVSASRRARLSNAALERA